MASLLLGAVATPIPAQSLNLSSVSRISSSHSQTFGTSFSVSTSALSVSNSSSPSTLYVYCGRGDKKTAKGKRFNHSFGNARPRNKKKGRGPPRVPVPPSPPRKDKFDDDEKITIELDESLFSN
ncbi:30S ribosomal protein S31, chloroplastic-like protein [Corchorus olitorius]|uniref:30S ribosomal protein S31, chloroplastic-like protein n=1 Tax=Corchorus olitorius TaxID=93759 RepID=A0A1R3JRK8_9ROSI|nr:30S ribosomal protein S31, chloroplastic-like protein [Corchorus olitorius]